MTSAATFSRSKISSFSLAILSVLASTSVYAQVDAGALQGGAFSVYRFSLNGAVPALQKALDEAAKKRLVKPVQPNGQSGFKDVTL